ncbi:hypothetical protein Pint_35840 [Pistacia integerrima]|uniref:Uncharacterized protein n=1 Tax=Pistacia integerrima TaxID=434235 RepID=A0ACC0Y3D1_9ROSI|nr:hypothetical protein Pint_35840 [Pistacia integerrima]
MRSRLTPQPHKFLTPRRHRSLLTRHQAVAVTILLSFAHQLLVDSHRKAHQSPIFCSTVDNHQSQSPFFFLHQVTGSLQSRLSNSHSLSSHASAIASLSWHNLIRELIEV